MRASVPDTSVLVNYGEKSLNQPPEYMGTERAMRRDLIALPFALVDTRDAPFAMTWKSACSPALHMEQMRCARCATTGPSVLAFER